MVYAFDTEVAEVYGLDEAVFLHNLYFWILKNEANGRHYYDGKSWTYNSVEAYTKLFPFWTKKQLRRITAHLEEEGAIITGCYNSNKMDRTKWYALSDAVYRHYSEGISLAQTVELQVSEPTNTVAQTDKSLTLLNTDINTDSNIIPPKSPIGKNGKLLRVLEESELSEKLKQSLEKWLRYKKFAYEEIGFRTLISRVCRKAQEHGEAEITDLIEECISNMWKGIIWDKLKPKQTNVEENIFDRIDDLV